MKYVCIALIKFYQVFISPYKGFRCAHHVLHQRASCSNKAKELMSQHSFLEALPLIRDRFTACRDAFDYLQLSKTNSPRGDLPCDLPCDVSVGDCGAGGASDSSASYCLGYCDLPFSRSDFSKRTRRIITFIVVASLFGFSYMFYGRDINTVYVRDLGVKNQNILQRIAQRQNPQIRVLLISNGEKIYSQIVKLDQVGDEYNLKLEKPLTSFGIDSLQVLDARVNIGNSLLVVGQVLEQFDKPKQNDQGKRFSYRIERRWHF